MFLVMGITGKVGGATAERLLARGKEVRALVRNREKASSWTNQGVELVDGDWNDSAAIERALKGVEGAFVMLPAVWAPSPDYTNRRRPLPASQAVVAAAARKGRQAFVSGAASEALRHIALRGIKTPARTSQGQQRSFPPDSPLEIQCRSRWSLCVARASS
jgi:uncharacterized protein YbjT (DUF2867 family)